MFEVFHNSFKKLIAITKADRSYFLEDRELVSGNGRRRSPARLLLAQAAVAAVTTTIALLCCGATALSVIQGTAQPHPSSPTSAQPSLSSSPFLVHTPSKEEGKHRTEGKEGKVCCSHLLAPLLLHPHSLTAKPSTPKEPLRS